MYVRQTTKKSNVAHCVPLSPNVLYLFGIKEMQNLS